MDSYYKTLLEKHGFRFKKALGQNFITDLNLLNAVAADSGVSENDTVVEIGAGAGSLTRVLCQKAAKVYAFEIDESLFPILEENLNGFYNFTLIGKNVLKISDSEFENLVGGEFSVVANLPYYITTPLLMRFVESGLKVKSLTLMMQKEVAERLTAEKGTPEYGAVTLAVALRGKAEIKRIIGKKCFYPVPQVDSAVVKITLSDRYGESGNKTLIKLIKAAFAMRRKTLANNLTASFSLTKQQSEEILRSAGFDPMVRGETLGMEELIRISKEIQRIIG